MLMVVCTQMGWSQQKMIVLKAKSNIASIRMGKLYYPDAWEMKKNSQSDPDNMNIEETKDSLTFMSVITDIDSIGYSVRQGQTIPFIVILNEKDTVWSNLKVGSSKGNFTEGYQKANDGKTIIDVPKLYELVNIIMAITPTGIRDSSLIEHDIFYYTKVQKAFSPFKNHRVVGVMDSLLKADKYYDVKMDGYSFEFDAKGQLVRKKEYNRVGWGGDNAIQAYIPLIQDFAKKSNFLKFYKQNEPFYNAMIKAYRDSLGVPEMQKWLNQQFPTTRYNCFKIIFSPLVNANQSTTSFESNGFKEGQPHVNFPDFWYNPKKSKVSEKSFNINRGNIVFTELNHLFENPEFDKDANSNAFNAIPFKMSFFAEKNKPAESYATPLSCVEEYMNWALVSLRFVDFAPKEDWETLFSNVEKNMVNYRGFIKFKEFNRFLIDIYTKRPQGKLVADLYPQIIDWFKENNH